MARVDTKPALESELPVLTLVIHGTFAADESWWRLGSDGLQTFADRLELALSKRGCRGSVWQPALARSFGYERFAWSGRNRDRDRRDGARTLAESLEALAVELGATRTRPLRLNLVAHSHGGNVTLEALGKLSDAIRIDRVVLLGTPLIEQQPALRLFRFGLACVMAAILFAFLVCGIAIVVCLPLDLLGNDACRGFSSSSGMSIYWMILLLPLVAAFYGWFLGGMAFLADVVWRALLAPFWGLRAVKQSYGPRASVLAKQLAGRRVLLLSGDDDEAGLLLQLGSAPGRLYDAYVASTFSPLGRWLERVFVRSIVVALLLRVSELLLEHWVLGFSWSSVFFFDYQVAEIDLGRCAYPRQVIERIDVSDRLSLTAARASAPSTARSSDARTSAAKNAIAAALVSAQTARPGERRTTRHALDLLENLDAMRTHIVSQIKLRHSLYYESSSALEMIADAIAGPTHEPSPSSAPPMSSGTSAPGAVRSL